MGEDITKNPQKTQKTKKGWHRISEDCNVSCLPLSTEGGDGGA